MGVFTVLTRQTILYLHGFASSSQSVKARQIAAFFATYYPQHQLLIPDLPYTPLEAELLLQKLVAQQPPDIVMGSSLGGFLATRIAEQLQCKAVLINPAVAPHLLLQQHLGHYRHPVLQQDYQLTQAHLPHLAALAVQSIQQPANYLVLLQTADEVLDYRQAAHFYRDCLLDVQSGGDHGYQGFAERLPDIVKFCQLA